MECPKCGAFHKKYRSRKAGLKISSEDIHIKSFYRIDNLFIILREMGQFFSRFLLVCLGILTLCVSQKIYFAVKINEQVPKLKSL